MREESDMEALLVKLGILAGLFGILGIVGLAAFLASMIWLIIRVANFDSVFPAVICVLLSVVLAAGGLVLSPVPEVHMEPLKAPWEILLERIAGARGDRAEDGGPEDSADKDAPPEMETIDADPASVLEPGNGESIPPEDAGPESSQPENLPEAGGELDSH
jgi:hypothetical protein